MAQGLAPGGLFYLSFAASGLANVSARVESRTIPSPSSPTVSLQFQEDRGYLNRDLKTYHRRGQFRSLACAQLTVTKV